MVVLNGDHRAQQVRREVHDRMPVILEAKDFEQWEHGDVMDADDGARGRRGAAQVAGGCTPTSPPSTSCCTT
jgi:hypothetical protein